MRLKKIGIIAALTIMFAAFLWAFDGVVLTPWVVDLGLSDIPTFVFMLHATASVFLAYFLFRKYQELKNLNKQDWLAFFLTGLFGGAIGTMAIIAAIVKVYSEGLNISVVLLLQKLQPIFAILLAILWLKERPKKTFYLWAIVALIGSYFLTFGFDQPDFNASGMFIPALLSILAAFSFGSSTVFSKKAVTKVSHGMGTALRFLITTGIMIVIIAVISLLNNFDVQTSYEGISGFRALNWNLIGAFVIIALTTGGTAIFIYYWGLKRVTAAQSTIYELMFPVSAIVLEYLIHDKILAAGQWFGSIIVIFSIVAIVRLKSEIPTPNTL
ncbi:MAG: EamA family transporter [Candidatus Kerfeldbacteria bacterium CG_4_10_14_0_8_um_filter_42_10]|uniref:EamA family transporter n=1 Tax=Candidatus Kerfeldbacteria bacterium CG_4_10_14_0_8_um_filter_42_10 TaxID=2014248 RepID=A0A2M7RG58_9BACT|nr:MAG: EamA family transporter [Candidatus Kerfeldbacteria bacterium CG_4_10_14_0_8_um_filter_42_10]